VKSVPSIDLSHVFQQPTKLDGTESNGLNIVGPPTEGQKTLGIRDFATQPQPKTVLFRGFAFLTSGSLVLRLSFV
jgi:hypothetical protein